jgi:hypothetical protein
MLGQIARLFTSGKTQPRHLSPLAAQVVETLGPQIAEARNFEQMLYPAIEQACAYFDRQITAIPDAGPIVPAANHSQSSLFSDADEIGRALGRSLEVKDALPGLARNGHQQIYALLGMRSRRQDRGAADLAPLADHTVHGLAPDLAAARDYLRLVAFKRLLNNFAAHVDKLRRKERLLKLEWNIQNRIVAAPENGDSGEYVDAAHELTPDNLLRGLIAWLETPENFFRLEPSGIPLTAPDAGSPAELPLLHCSDRRQWLVCFVTFSTADALQGLEQETHAHRYMLI